MIVDNYNNSLAENKESLLTFTSLASPVLSVRMFNHNLIQGESHLVIPYCVSDCDHREYTSEEILPTFTTIVTVDEDTVPQDQVRVWKKTTYAGEQLIDLGVFDDLGPHTFNIRTIQSNGIGSITKLLKFIVRKPESQRTVIDLSSGGSFQSEFDNYTRYGFTCDGNNVIYEEYNCTYSVTCSPDADNNINDISIVVSHNQLGKNCYTAKDVTNYKGDLASSYHIINDFVGEYRLTTHCVVNGVDRKLTEFLHTDMQSLPRIVIETAAKNKVALTRLFEAAKAYGADKIILPKLDIVCDYHYARDYSTDLSLDISLNESLPHKDSYRDSITIPDGLWVDLNKSDIFVLQTTNNYIGYLFTLNYSFDSHLVNGSVSGNWIGSQHSWQQDGEHRSVLEIRGSQFCSFENLKIVGTTGYDVMVSSFDGAHWATSRKVYDKIGFIDYSGVAHTSGDVYGNDSENYEGFMYTSSLNLVADAQWFVDHNVFRPNNYSDGGYDTRQIHSLTCKTISISFYDENQTFIKTVKTSERIPTLAPYGAVHARLCKYGTSEFGKYDSINDSASAGRFAFCYRSMIGWANSIVGCDIFKTRQVIFANGSAQTVIKDCRMFCINGERSSHYSWGLSGGVPTVKSEYAGVIRNASEQPDPIFGFDWYSIYPTLVVDIEDECRQSYYNFWDNVELVCGKVDAFAINGGVDMHFKNCRNIALGFGYYSMGVLIENCSLCVNTDYAWWLNGSDFVIKNSIVKSLGNCTSHRSMRGAYTGDLYIRNNDVAYLNNDGALNSLIHDYSELKM